MTVPLKSGISKETLACCYGQSSCFLKDQEAGGDRENLRAFGFVGKTATFEARCFITTVCVEVVWSGPPSLQVVNSCHMIFFIVTRFWNQHTHWIWRKHLYSWEDCPRFSEKDDLYVIHCFSYQTLRRHWETWQEQCHCKCCHYCFMFSKHVKHTVSPHCTKGTSNRCSNYMESALSWKCYICYFWYSKLVINIWAVTMILFYYMIL